MLYIENIRRWAQTDRVALVDQDRVMTFAALNARSDAIALWLGENRPDRRPVVLWGDKDHDMLTVLLGAVKAGHSYVIIPDHYPASRAMAIIKDCGSDVLFQLSDKPMPFTGSEKAAAEPQSPPSPTTAQQAPQLADIVYNADDIDSWVRLYRDVTDPVFPGLAPDDLCSVFYTSGSTGQPKGVQITRANVEAFIDSYHEYIFSYLPPEACRVLNVSSYAYIVSLANIFYILAVRGYTLYAVSRDLAMNYKDLFSYILEVKPQYLTGTPSFAAVCLQDDRFSPEYLPELCCIEVGGENLPIAVGRKLIRRFPKALLFNGYGMTETTCGGIECQITEDMLVDGQAMCIGESFSAVQCAVVNDDLQELPDGQVGELIMIGAMISPGYYHNPELTRQKFFTTPDGRRGVHTGDLVYRRQNRFYYVGRKDNLVKVGGYRVEIEEIEQHLSRVSLIKECAVVPVLRDGQVIMTAAYVTLDAPPVQKLQSILAIRKEMGQMVQSYMIPQKIVILDELPSISHSGKVDRNRLKEMARLS